MNRREFLAGITASAAAGTLHAQMGGARASVAEMERAHVLAAIALAEQRPGEPITPLPYVDALRKSSPEIAAYVAGYLLTQKDDYVHSALARIRGQFLSVSEDQDKTQSPEGVTDLLPIAEIARATSFLLDHPAVLDEDRNALQQRFSALLLKLNNEKGAQLARDSKDHHASAWLLLSSALARATKDEKQLELNRLRFKKPTLRIQIDSTGRFPQEAATSDPLRNTLFNFDLLAGCAQLLTTPFEDMWTFELPEGLGMRVTVSSLYPLLADLRKWPLPADSSYFREVPLRRPGLLFAGRAYSRVEYVDLFRSLPFAAPPEAIAYSVPIRQPLLWTTKVPHGL